MNDFIIETKGFISTNNNCFLNCLIMAMFVYKKSPFYTLKNFSNKKSKIFHNCLLNIMKSIGNNKQYDITFIRKILPLHMQYGQQDATETFDNIMKFLEYEPIKTIIIRENKSIKDKIVESSSITHKNSYICLNNNGEDNITPIEDLFYPKHWEDLGNNISNWVKDDKNKPKYRFTRTKVKEMTGDVLIFTINRSSGQNKRHSNRVKTPYMIQNENDVFFRTCIILHLGSNIHFGHYILVICDKNNYYVYNDMSNITINKNEINYKKIQETIERNSIMYFYYKSL